MLFFQHNNTAIVHIHTLTCGWGITPVCSVHIQLLTGSGYIPHQVVARVAHVGGSGADSPSSQCDCAKCWVVQLATDCCRERHHVQCIYSMYYSSETNHYQICSNYFCDTLKKLYIHTYIYAMCLQYGINFALYSFLMIFTKKSKSQ